MVETSKGLDGKVRAVWLLVECPSCHAPQVLRKHVMDNTVSSIRKQRYEVCEECGKGFFVKLEEMDMDIQ